MRAYGKLDGGAGAPLKSAMGKATEHQPRRRRSKRERRQIVEESLQPGVSVARLALAHQVNANQIFHWRKLYREGLLADEAENAAVEWLPVRVADVSPEQPHQAPPAQTPGVIEVELPRGRVRIEGAPDAGALRLVLELLGA